MTVFRFSQAIGQNYLLCCGFRFPGHKRAAAQDCSDGATAAFPAPPRSLEEESQSRPGKESNLPFHSEEAKKGRQNFTLNSPVFFLPERHRHQHLGDRGNYRSQGSLPASGHRVSGLKTSTFPGCGSRFLGAHGATHPCAGHWPKMHVWLTLCSPGAVATWKGMRDGFLPFQRQRNRSAVKGFSSGIYKFLLSSLSTEQLKWERAPQLGGLL